MIKKISISIAAIFAMCMSWSWCFEHWNTWWGRGGCFFFGAMFIALLAILIGISAGAEI